MYDRCTWPLNQTISNLVQASKQVKTWAVSRPRTHLGTPKGAEWPREHRCTQAWNTDCVSHACIAGGFSKGLLSKNREGCGYKEVHTYPSSCIKVDCKPTTSSHGFDSLRELSLLGSVADHPLPWDNSHGYSLRQRPFYKQPIFGWGQFKFSKLQLDSIAVTLPWKWNSSQGQRFFTWD